MKIVHRNSDVRKLIELSLSDDKLKLFARVEPREEASQLGDEEIFAEISTVCPADLVDKDVVKDITKGVRHGVTCEERRVAKGAAPIEGRDGKIVWLVRRLTGEVDHSEREYLPDLFHLGLFENIRRGQQIARIYPPTVGRAGRDVLGAVLQPRNGKPAQAKLGKSVRLERAAGSERYEVVIAEVDGYALEEGGRITMKEVLDISGDVDYRTGHIDFIGGVRVHGNVNKGFNVRARGVIEILGSVAGDNVLASEKGISIKGHHFGGERGSLFTQGDYVVSVAEGVRAEVRGAITIGKEARQCSIRCASVLLAPKASVVGGSLWCVGGIDVETLGNEAGLATRVELHNAREVTSEYQELYDSIALHKKAKQALELHLGPYAFDRRRVPLLHGEYRDKITAIIQKYDQITHALAKLQHQAKIVHESSRVSDGVQINVRKMMFPGVLLVSNDVELKVLCEKSGPLAYTFLNVSNEWVSVEYRSLDGKGV